MRMVREKINKEMEEIKEERDELKARRASV
jgi:hypothetical protein